MGSDPRLTTRRCNFQWLQGQNKTLTITARDPPPEPLTGVKGDPIDLTGKTIRMRARLLEDKRRDNDLQPLAFELSSDNINEIEILDQLMEDTIGVFKVYIKSLVTDKVRPGCYGYTIEMVDPFGEITPLLVGEIYFEARI